MRLRDLVRGVVPEELIGLVPSSFDIVGSRSGAVAIIELPDELDPYKAEIAEAITRMNRHVRAVLRRIGPRKGEYRLYEYEVLLGGRTEVLHREHGYAVLVDPTKAYFSPRDQTDRERIASMVGEGEVVLYMFAGVGPYAFAIIRRRPEVGLIIAVEANPDACYYLHRNIRINRALGKVLPLCGDVRRLCPRLGPIADRVLMTLPLGAVEFLEIGISNVGRGGGYLHFYHVGGEPDPFGDAEMRLEEACSAQGRNCNVVGRQLVREYAPRAYKVRIDVKIK